jgi:hypothetical protein
MLVTKAELAGFILAVELIKITGGDTSLWADLKALADEIGMDEKDFDLAINFLVRKKLIKGYGAGYTYFISDLGIDEVTRAVKFPDKSTESFSPLNDIKAILKANGKTLLL